LPGALVQGTIAFAGQAILTSFKHWRIKTAIHRLENPRSDEKLARWNSELVRKENGSFLPDRTPSGFDPMKDLMEGFRDIFINLFFPDAPSYVVNATNLEYRRKLSLKILILEDQINTLKEELKQNGIDFNNNS
jgi:hypothetical protein